MRELMIQCIEQNEETENLRQAMKKLLKRHNW